MAPQRTFTGGAHAAIFGAMFDLFSDDPLKQIRNVFIGAAAVVAVYAPAALWIQHAFVPVAGPPGAVALVIIERLEGGGLAFKTRAYPLHQFEDDQLDAQRSPVVLYEDNKPLGPSHSRIDDIAKFGGGRYSHWKDIGFVFSASDSSDARKNGHNYWAVLPDSHQ